MKENEVNCHNVLISVIPDDEFRFYDQNIYFDGTYNLLSSGIFFSFVINTTPSSLQSAYRILFPLFIYVFIPWINEMTENLEQNKLCHDHE